MLHCQVEGAKAEQCECPVMHSENSAETFSSVEPQASDRIQPLEVQSAKRTTNIEESFKVDCKLPLNTLLSPINITDPLLMCSISELNKEEQAMEPYFIPELDMACAGQEVERVAEETLIETGPELKLPENQPINDSITTETNETKFPPMEALNVSSLAEFSEPVMEKSNISIEEVNLKGAVGIIEPLSDKPNIQPVKSAEKLQTKSLGIQIPPLKIEDLISPLIEKPKIATKLGVISFLTGNKLALTPSVRLSFGDRVTTRRNTKSKEIIQQQASKSLKALISVLTMQKRLEASQYDNSNNSQTKRFEQLKSSLSFSRVFRHNIFQSTSEMENRQLNTNGNSLESGEPNFNSPSEHKEPLPIPYRLDAGEGLTCNGLNVSKDSVFSEVSESDVSETQNELFAMKKPQKGLKSIAKLSDILNNGRVLFSQPVRLFCFNKLKEWKRQGEGQIEVIEHDGSYYIVLHDKVSGELIIYMRVDERWRIDYMTKSSYSCRWTNINYANCRDGILERIACSFREPSHAAEFVARVRNSALQSRLECSS
ncbi:E3 SUMO-protein ligase RanBP2 isoform X4 [Drosophila mauritiana]|uniref:E3 SUMO-protein ligase RanBP2 isoform X4 n=1 Tax=Drosophila mauritiana TaxID=7226 RepID=A0A6P8JXG4_DROMA|nr:E3 SUMO-protein ligase RanBP2 isoform X4 [Drosophila mauritiana]